MLTTADGWARPMSSDAKITALYSQSPSCDAALAPISARASWIAKTLRYAPRRLTAPQRSRSNTGEPYLEIDSR